MALNDLLDLMEASQVQDFVPLDEQVVVVFELAYLSGREFNNWADSLAEELSKHGPCSNIRPEWRWRRG